MALGIIPAPIVNVLARGGRRVRAGNLEVLDWYWEMRLDEPGEAGATVLDPCAQLYDPDRRGDPVEDWVHELEFVHGDPGGESLAGWVGPITKVDSSAADGRVILTARSVSAWYDRRTIDVDVNAAQATLDGGDLLRLVHAAAMAIDPSPLFGVSADTMGLSGVRTWIGQQQANAGQAVRELADTVLDYVDYGRTVLVRPILTRATVSLTDSDFTSPPRVVSDGDLRATRVVFAGASGTTPQSATASAEYTDRYGVVTRRFSDSKIIDNASLLAAATARLQLLRDALLIDTRGTLGLTSDAPVELADLIPGAVFHVDIPASWCATDSYAGDFRLAKVRVQGSGRGNVEVLVDLTPLGQYEGAD